MIEFKGLKRTINRFSTMVKNMNMPNKAMAKIAITSWKNVRNHFDTEQDSTGKSWPKWKHPDQKRNKGQRVSARPTKRGGTKLLQDRGRLKGSILYGVKYKIARVYVKLKYAATHNYGDAKRNIDKREYMYLDRETKERIKDIYVDMILKR